MILLCNSVLQVRPGTGFVCEPFEGRKDKTLVTLIVHVSLKELVATHSSHILTIHFLCRLT